MAAVTELAAPAGNLSKSQHAYQVIRAAITDGSYAPGHRLVLGRIAEELNVSVVPVREAIRMLEAEGLVTFERNVGAQVAMLDPTEYQYTMETLGLVEGAATAMAAPLITEDDIARARRVNASMHDLLAEGFDAVRFTELNHQFHSVLYERCPNPHILDLVGRGWGRLSHLRESVFGFVPERAAQSVEEHDRLLDLIQAGADPAEIEAAARRHRIATLDAYLAQVTTTEGKEDE